MRPHLLRQSSLVIGKKTKLKQIQREMVTWAAWGQPGLEAKSKSLSVKRTWAIGLKHATLLSKWLG